MAPRYGAVYRDVDPSDKNIGNQDEANKMFKELQRAYTVLIDPNERAWWVILHVPLFMIRYDNHKEAILRGVDTTVSQEEVYEERFVNVWPYFSESCYFGFGDDDNVSRI